MPKTKRRTVSHSRPKSRTSRRHSSTAIVPATPAPIVVQKNRERQLTNDEIELLKRTVCKGADNDEFALFLWTCKKHKLDPITRQIYAVFRNVTKHHQDEKGIWVSGKQMTIQMGIDGLRALAGRHHSDFGGSDEPTFVMSGNRTPAGREIPESASVRLWKKGLEHPIVGVAYWDEFAPRDLSATNADFYNRMPRHMLAKCAEALAIRKGYPDLSDIYTDAEMVQADQDYTPEGRIITDSKGFAPSGRAITYEAQHTGSRAAAQAVAARKIAEANAERKPLEAEIVDTPAPPKEYQGSVELDWTEETSPIIRGDIANLLDLMKKHCTMTWGKDEWWHCLPKDGETIRAMCQQLSFKLTEIMPKPKSFPPREKSEGAQSKAPVSGAQAKAPPQSSGAKATPANKTSAAPAASPASNEPHVVTGVISQFTEKMTKGTRANPEKGIKGRASVPYLTVLIKTDKGSQWCSAFDHTLFPFIQKGKVQKKGEFVVQKSGEFWNLLGFRKLESLTFDEDNKTPCIQRDREPGTPSMFQP